MQIDRTVGIDHALDDNGITAVAGQFCARQLASSELGNVLISLIPGHRAIDGSNPVQLVHSRGIGGRNSEAADVDDATGADDKTMRISKDDIAADLATLEAVEGAVNDCARIMHQVDQVTGTTRDVQVNRVAGIDGEIAEGVEPRLASHRSGRDIGINPIGDNRRIGRSASTGIHDDVVG